MIRTNTQAHRAVT